MEISKVTTLAEQLIEWSWEDQSKHPKDRLTDHQALDIALRMQASAMEPAGSAGRSQQDDGSFTRKLGE